VKSGKKRPLRSLRNSEGFKQFVLDQLEELDVTGRLMFGGCGLYCGENFFGIIASDVLYLRVDETNRGDYTSAGMKPFKPYPGRGGTMRYYAVPLSVLESAPDLAKWARAAIRVAQRASHP
jgi:DNA transformation protein